jgi:uncharacterized protein (DUF1800 family)
LLRRAGFAPSEEEARAALDAGPAATVERLVRETRDSERHDELDETGRALAMRQEIDLLRGWWLLRMCHTRRPLQARMTLFWHNHFATSNAKVQSPALMLQQLRTLERFALGKFEDLLLAVSRDPAMIVWLDGNENSKGRPNENYARELFELFSLGVGHYTEADIKQAARAFTGWHVRGGVFRLLPSEHDDDSKTVLGVSGSLNGEDVVGIAVKQTACATFLSGKLLREFVCPEPPADLVSEFAGMLRESGFDLARSMQTLLLSEAMFDPRWYRSRIKSPTELAVGVLRSLGRKVAAAPLAEAVSQAGQRLLEPPSVKGWDGHRAWLNSATMLVRLNAVSSAVRDAVFKAAEFRGRYDLTDRERIVRFCEELTLDGRVPPGLRDSYPPESTDLDATLRGVLRVLFCSPEYQMA